MARQSSGHVKNLGKTEASKDPSTPSMFYKCMAHDWSQISTILGGTATMRRAAQTLLPQHEGESNTRYKERLAVSVFTNYTALTLEYWVGKPFSKPVVFTTETDPDIVELGDDIDLCGNDLTVVCRDWFTKGLEKQVAYCLVDYPTVENASKVTIAQQKEQNLRPYWCILPAESVIATRKERRNGEEVFTHVRFYDNEPFFDGYEESIRFQIREYNRTPPPAPLDGSKPSGVDLVTVRTWQFDPTTKKWIDKGVVETSQPFIPLVEFNTGKLELRDLGYLNITHWQSSSDQRNCLTVARFPILAASGVDKQTVVTIGPWEFLSASDPQGKFYYVEHSGAALGTGDKDIEGLVTAMALYGAEMLRDRPDRQTATSAILDTSQANTPLGIHVHSFTSAVNQALYFTKLWMNKEESIPAQVVVNTDFAMSNEESAQVEGLYKAHAAGVISDQQLIAGLMEYKRLPQGFDVKKNTEELDAKKKAEADLEVDKATRLAKAAPKPAPPKG